VAGFDWTLGTSDDDAVEPQSPIGRQETSDGETPHALSAPELAVAAAAVLVEAVIAPSSDATPLAPPMSRRELREREGRVRRSVPAAASVVPVEAEPEIITPITDLKPVETVSVQAAPAEAAPAVTSVATALPVISALAPAPSADAPEVEAPQDVRAERLARLVKEPRKASRPPQAAAETKPHSSYHVKRRVFSKLASVGAMVGVIGLMISTSLPANAFFEPAAHVTDSAASSSSSEPAQSMKVADAATVATETRDNYSVMQKKFLYGGLQSFTYTNNINGTIQWPFPEPVPISSGFGPRIAPCGGCSSMHEGVDFIPGAGTAIDSIADGVVSQVVNSHAGLGNHVVVDHVINGQKVQSVYAHMLDGSIRVVVGQAVKVAQQLGQVGSTGESTGAHLHLEIHLDGVPVDPFAWLKANAN
jgi:murein DD-endopeptidase MepM/ murein hydrolase activator NlpD